MNEFKISEIQILPIKPKDGHVGFCSFIINNQFYLGNIGIHLRPSGNEYRLVYPTAKLINGKIVSCVHPINKRTGDFISEIITGAYKRFLMKMCRKEELTKSEKKK